MRLTTEQAEDPEMVEDFECPLCLQIPELMVTCSECTQIFCTPCIDDSVKLQPECPTCQEEFVPAKLSKALLKILYRTKFKCKFPDCGESFLYEHRRKHFLVEGPRLNFVCPLDCGVDYASLIDSPLTLVDHLKTSCTSDRLKCAKCNTNIYAAYEG